MSKTFNAREFIDYTQLAAFIQKAGAAITVNDIRNSSNSTWVLFSFDDDDALKALDVGAWSHQGPGRGFTQGDSDASIAYVCDIKSPARCSPAPICVLQVDDGLAKEWSVSYVKPLETVKPAEAK